MTDHGRATIAFKTLQVDAGEFSGYAGVVGNVDDGGDRILPGAFRSAIPRFLREGFIALGHDWNRPVAYPTEAHEDDHGLYLRARFHGTRTAQEARQVVDERVKAGLSVGLSIGYQAGRTTPTPHGRDIHEIARVFETSIVTVPMNTLAGVTAVKRGRSPADLALDAVATANRQALERLDAEVRTAERRRRLDNLAGMGRGGWS